MLPGLQIFPTFDQGRGIHHHDVEALACIGSGFKDGKGVTALCFRLAANP